MEYPVPSIPMKMKKFLFFCASLVLLLALACSGGAPLMSPVLKRSDPSSDIIKDYQCLTLSKPGLVDTGVRLSTGDAFTLLPRQTLPKDQLSNKVGTLPSPVSGTYHNIA